MKSPLWIALTITLTMAPSGLAGQDAETIRITHRFDWRRSIDQKYQGLVYGYLTGAWKLAPSSTAGWTDVEARYYLASESRKNNALTEKPIDAELTSRFQITPQGTMTNFMGDGIPYYRNFPAPLPHDAGPGSVWTGNGALVGDFLGTGTTTRIPILIEYRWEGPGDYLGTKVIQVKTQYALRYRNGLDRDGDPTLSLAEGTHIGMVSYDAATKRVVFIRENAREAFVSTSGTRVGNEGILLTFFEGVPALGTASLVRTFHDALGKPAPESQPAAPGLTKPETGLVQGSPGSGSKASPPGSTRPGAGSSVDTVGPGTIRSPSDNPDIRVEADPRGVKITLDNLKFVADQAALLPGEERRLATIAELLKTVPDRNLLVVGHTAAVGTEASQDQLSLDRARAIVERLKSAGVPPSRLLYEGRGGREPAASNDTEQGRAQNRRVEIIILDQ